MKAYIHYSAFIESAAERRDLLHIKEPKELPVNLGKRSGDGGDGDGVGGLCVVKEGREADASRD